MGIPFSLSLPGRRRQATAGFRLAGPVFNLLQQAHRPCRPTLVSWSYGLAHAAAEPLPGHPRAGQRPGPRDQDRHLPRRPGLPRGSCPRSIGRTNRGFRSDSPVLGFMGGLGVGGLVRFVAFPEPGARDRAANPGERGCLPQNTSFSSVLGQADASSASPRARRDQAAGALPNRSSRDWAGSGVGESAGSPTAVRMRNAESR